ncbi:hypothetical protein [Calycomorphotria hydatis]|uniref:Uncharacterized protein n=1 Tax=Calycomorphotria hydatis TaxID=2528027 RepID=A0A517TEP9_9PLAN|nr:hypothetical protein [Calycomorphotria hydatis]QDT66850.1 hypothetical protein V22_41220 [Calycomorphotria hydatis]
MLTNSIRCQSCRRPVPVSAADREAGTARCPECMTYNELSGGAGGVVTIGCLALGMVGLVVSLGVIIYGLKEFDLPDLTELADGFQKPVGIAADNPRVIERDQPAGLSGRGDFDPNSSENRMRTLGLAMFMHATQDRRSRLLPVTEQPWRIALGRETKQYEPNRLGGRDGRTQFLLVTGPGTLFDPGIPRSGSMLLVDISPRAAETIPLLIEVGPDRAVPYDSNEDFVLDPERPKAGLGDVGREFLVLMADGSVRRFPSDMTPQAFLVLCQLAPSLNKWEFGLIEEELKRLGLPSEPMELFPKKSQFE